MKHTKGLNSDCAYTKTGCDFRKIGSVNSISNIPDKLKLLDQWSLWIGRSDDKGKINKPPYRSVDLSMHAKIDKPHTFSSFDVAISSLLENEAELLRRTTARGCPGMFGLNFALTASDPCVGIDLDEAINTETGEISNFAINIINQINGYTEYSPSGTGIRIFAEGKLSGGGLNTTDSDGHQIELYDRAHFLSVTGNVFT